MGFSMGFSRQEYWGRLPFPSPGDLPNPGTEPRSPALRADALTSEPPGKQGFRGLELVDCTAAHPPPRGGGAEGPEVDFSPPVRCLSLSGAPRKARRKGAESFLMGEHVAMRGEWGALGEGSLCPFPVRKGNSAELV